MERIIKQLIFIAIGVVVCIGAVTAAREERGPAGGGSFRQNTFSAPANIQSERSFSGGFSRSTGQSFARAAQPQMPSAPIIRQQAPVPQFSQQSFSGQAFNRVAQPQMPPAPTVRQQTPEVRSFQNQNSSTGIQNERSYFNQLSMPRVQAPSVQVQPQMPSAPTVRQQTPETRSSQNSFANVQNDRSSTSVASRSADQSSNRASRSDRPSSAPQARQQVSGSQTPATQGSNTIGSISANGRVDRNSSSNFTASQPTNNLSGGHAITNQSRIPNNFNNATRSTYFYRNRDWDHDRDRDHFYPNRTFFSWITWPDTCYPIYYSWGPYSSVDYFWPYYQHKFVFVSLNGYWPDYDYMRYYWYGWQPYDWYGYYPPSYEVPGNTYNYYYYTNEPPAGVLNNPQTGTNPQQPAPANQADNLFQKGVTAFGNGDYAGAAADFQSAEKLAPNDIVMPYAYVQALFANGQYKKAAEELRYAVEKASPNKEGVFYPRGLYNDQQVLQQQINQLEKVVQTGRSDADLELLLGYQLLGIGQYDQAASHLQIAGTDSNNAQAAGVLSDMLTKLSNANQQQTITTAEGQDINSRQTQPSITY
jgi:tetratricopeptide (TPR) repeat protein